MAPFKFPTLPLITATVALVGIAAPPTLAQEELIEENGIVTGINYLEIPGFGIFNVSFEFQSFNELFFDPVGSDGRLPQFWNDAVGGEAAANSIIAALGSDAITNIPNIPEVGLVETDSFFIPFGFLDDSGFVQSFGDSQTLSLEEDELTDQLFASNTQSNLLPWAVFTPCDSDGVCKDKDDAQVPEPSSLLAVLTLGTMGLIGVKQKKKI